MIIVKWDDEELIVDCEGRRIVVKKEEFCRIGEGVFDFLLKVKGEDWVRENFEGISSGILESVICMKCEEGRNVN